MARKSQQSVASTALPFAVDSTDPYAGRTPAERAKVAKAIAAAKAAGASGNEMRATFGEKLTGPARRKVLREHGFDGRAYIAPSYTEYQDGDTRVGSRHAREHGHLAEARRAEAREAAEAELTAARKAKKGRTKAERAAYADRVQRAEEAVAALA